MDGGVDIYEVSIHGYATVERALEAQESIARLLCPAPEHAGPCEVPWGFSLAETPGVGPETLVLGVWAEAARAAEIAESVRRLTGQQVSLEAGDPREWETLAEQVRIERGPGSH